MSVESIFDRLAHRLGGQVQAAKILKVTQPAVSGWVTGANGMSAVVALRAERATDGEFKAIDLCPALKAELESA